ncbi:hypothetical protein [Mucilaginibacter endophyticus]|uniref:hypothetical protein n=1 Tax=Mucilaginibacter endophyticus TaxID=2675003 RepID=UPI000E0DB11B|nr:hypothetical protein [Mucilaginibacter endophyticus]
MENYQITIRKNKEVRHFVVGEYLHHDGENCKFKIFEDGKFVASFEPDAHQFLHICQNPNGLDEAMLHLLAEEIESHHSYSINDNIKKLKS